MTRILFQGDSITDGGRIKTAEVTWDKNHQIGHSYVFSIAATLGRKYPGKYEFINRGVAAHGVYRTAERWQTDTLDENPDILSILLGINDDYKNVHDGIYPEGVEAHLERFEEQYRQLLSSAKENNPKLKIIMMEPFFLAVKNPEEHYANFWKVFARRQEIVRKLANEFDAIFVPVQKPLEALVKESAPILAANGYDALPAAYWLWDNIHPTEAMHGFLAELWLEAAKPIL